MISWQQQVTLSQLEVFVAVARSRTYTHAAEELSLSQPMVSAQVHELERLVGLPLFERVGEQCILTQAGSLLKEPAQKMLAVAEEAADALECLHQRETDHLLVAASTTVGTYLLPRMLGPFRVSYPSVQLVLELKSSEAVCEDVRAGRIELGVIERTGERADDELLLAPFHEDELLLIVPPGHPWAGLGKVPAAALAQATLLWTEPGSDTRSVVEAALHRSKVRPHVTMQIGDIEAIKRAVMAGIGVAIISQAAVSAEVTAGLLAPVRLADAALRQTFHLVSQRGGHLSPLTQVFLRLLTGELESATTDE